MMQDRRPTAETHRDTRDSVWKRIDSRFNSRDEHRSDARPEHYPRGRERKVQNKESGDKQHQDKGVYNKRRYEESFSQSKKKENERRVGDGENLNRINAGADRAAGTSRVPSPLPLPDVSADSQRTISDHNMKPVNYRSSSPEHRRERPFMLSLSKRLTAEEKLKGKLPESGDTSDAASSAKKSLFLNSNQNLPAPVLPRATPLEPATNQKPMSWYEMTMEDEEEAIEAQLGQENQTLPKENLVNPELEMDAEKILEAEDWMDEEGAYDVDNDDLLDEEDLQEEDLGIPIPSPFGASESGVIPVREDVPCQMETSPPKKLASTGTSPLHRAGTPKRVSPSTSKKKKNSPSPLVAGLSLKKRNMMLGMGSPKEKTKKNGPTPAQEKDQNLPISKTVSPSYTGQKKAKELNAKSSKVGSISGDTEGQCAGDTSSKRGGWITFPFMMGMSITSFGWVLNLIVFLIEEFNIKNIAAAQISNIVNGCLSMLPVVAAILADSFFGNIVVISASTFISLTGIILLTLIASLDSLKPRPCETGSVLCQSPSELQLGILYTALVLVTTGGGGTRFTLASAGANQYEKPKDQGSFFNWYFLILYAGAITGATAIVYTQDNASWKLGFGLCAAANMSIQKPDQCCSLGYSEKKGCDFIQRRILSPWAWRKGQDFSCTALQEL
ncbi:hypothetical protein Bca4012_068585 [Brassica carinata]